MKNIKFDFDDILIEPEIVTTINSRYDDINLEYNPLFTAPMDTVCDETNYELFLKQGINVCLSRVIKECINKNDINKVFHSYSLEDFKEYFIDNKPDNLFIKINIDLANGHISKLHETIKESRKKYGNKIEIMTGNIGNPKTLKVLDEIGVNYARVSIGSGSGCISSQQTGIGYPIGSLIHECYQIKKENDLKIKIIADGGMKKYSDIIKSIALGSDFVMIGGLFNKCLESCAPTYIQNIKHENWTEPGDKIDQYDPIYKQMLKSGTKFYKKFRGMSTKEVQIQQGKENIRTSEGITKLNQVEYTLESWMENFNHYLRSAMSYTNSRNLEEFKGSRFNFITSNALKRFEK